MQSKIKVKVKKEHEKIHSEKKSVGSYSTSKKQLSAIRLLQEMSEIKQFRNNAMQQYKYYSNEFQLVSQNEQKKKQAQYLKKMQQYWWSNFQNFSQQLQQNQNQINFLRTIIKRSQRSQKGINHSRNSENNRSSSMNEQ